MNAPDLANIRVEASPLLTRLGVRHGFSTRSGGVSDGPFESLNLAYASGDERARVEENRRRFLDACAFGDATLFQVSQVHGSAVREIVEGDRVNAVVLEEADAVVARSPGHVVGVRIADCVPVLVVDARTGHVAAIHAGWRGVVSNVVGDAIARLLSGSVDHALTAAIGPCIGACCFEVGRDVADVIEQAVPVDGVVVGSGDKPRVDLRRAVRMQLRALGVDDARIDDVGGCTRCDADRYFSYRRDGARSGRMLAAIAPVG